VPVVKATLPRWVRLRRNRSRRAVALLREPPGGLDRGLDPVGVVAVAVVGGELALRGRHRQEVAGGDLRVLLGSGRRR